MKSLETGVIDIYEMLDVCAATQTWDICKSSMCFLALIITPALLTL